MGTLVEEIFSKKAGRVVQAGQIVLLDVDTILSHDNTTPLAIKAFREIGKPIADKTRVVIHFDHAYPAPNLLAAETQKKALDFIKEQGIQNFFHQGVCHQVMIEEGFVRPGAVIIGGDSHTNTYGALGAFASGYRIDRDRRRLGDRQDLVQGPPDDSDRAGRPDPAGCLFQGCDALPGGHAGDGRGYVQVDRICRQLYPRPAHARPDRIFRTCPPRWAPSAG